MTPRIPQLDYAEAGEDVRAAHDEEMRLRGRMTNMKRTLLHSPPALRIYGEWFTLRDQLLPVLGNRAILLFAQAICRASRSRVGASFMQRALIQSGEDPDHLAPTEAETALIALGAALGTDPQSVPDPVWDRVAALYPDKTLVDLTAFAGLMVATNLFTDVVRTEFDPELEPFAVTFPDQAR
ncbi:hypothetical protein EMQ25_13855 [Arsenicitalea aurantiaca]|uniref:Carboxymuconolactone decarboxylase family protein n=1 Tax=Arsenicitalea aurantiaca TaxID=1783274 RepID=A0A433X8J1_9HYPH|nr:hypothetical protein [Arsenicitalea aurantiaca]RUT30386.1 hypothetical protein EMQ25_13855 [Arsenicitalea aurantiaca]